MMYICAMNLHEDNQISQPDVDWLEKQKGMNAFGEFSCCILKKCCKKYKKGKRCKKCPNK